VKLGKLDSLLKRVQGTLRTDDIALHQISLAPEGFDARFSALSRTYEYRIDDRGSKRNPLHHLFTYRSSFSLDDAAMNAVSQKLCGLHDFAAFCRPKPGATTIRHLTHFAWTRDADGILTGSVIADAFYQVEPSTGEFPREHPPERDSRTTRIAKELSHDAHIFTQAR
jgi:tRNA pseudouridine38-40 synthase